MFKRLLPFVIIFVVMLIDTAVLPMYVSSWLLPAFTLVSVQCLGLLLGRSRGLLYGLIAGLTMDILVGTPLGVMTILYAAIGYLGGIFMRAFSRSRLTPVVCAAVCFVLYEMIMAGYSFMIDLQFDLSVLVYGLVRAGVAVVCVQIFYWLYRWILKPSKSRFATR